MPRVADLPRGWRHWSPAEKIEHLLGMTLDRAHEILSWPIPELDPFRLSVRVQVMRIVFTIGTKGAAQWQARPRRCPQSHLWRNVPHRRQPDAIDLGSVRVGSGARFSRRRAN
jgi:hypothetical protein